ncbi:MAG TPA: hypothetical protein VKY85_04605 [Candidatus Angelobacter sp.]|nr:hypothetical protein [Candidatus Angelobacter sp.]
MHPRRRFAELSDSLKNGFLADEIVLALARAENGEELSEHDRAALEKATAMLEAAIKGYKWLDDPKLSTETRASADFFGRAVGALPRVYTSSGFFQQVSDLTQTVNELSNGGTPSKDKIRGLRTFFFNAAQSELDRTDQLLTGEDSTDALEWIAID